MVNDSVLFKSANIRGEIQELEAAYSWNAKGEFSFSVYLYHCGYHNHESWILGTWYKEKKPFVQFSAMWLMNIQAQKALVALNSHWEMHVQTRSWHGDKWNWNYSPYYFALNFCHLLFSLHPLLLLEGEKGEKREREMLRICFLKGVIAAHPHALHYRYFQNHVTPARPLNTSYWFSSCLTKSHIQVQSLDWGCLNYQAPSMLPMCQSPLLTELLAPSILSEHLFHFLMLLVGLDGLCAVTRLFNVSCVLFPTELWLSDPSLPSRAFPALTMCLWPWPGSGFLQLLYYLLLWLSWSQLLTLQTPLCCWPPLSLYELEKVVKEPWESLF